MHHDENKVISVIMLAGKILLESGAETYRVEDTMTRIAEYYGLDRTHSFVTPTAIIFSLSNKSATQLTRITDRTTDLVKISETNEISRAITSGTMTLDTAKEALHELDHANLQYRHAYKILAASIVSACFLLMFKGVWPDVLPSFIAGGIGLMIADAIQLRTRVKFFAEFAAAFVIALLAHLFVYYLGGVSINTIIIASVMPLVPGVLITNAIRDLMASQLLAGTVKGVEASLTAFAIGTGVAVCLMIF